MISLFLFKSNARGMQYGMGTYLRELTEALLLYTGIKIYIITHNRSDCNEFSIEAISERYFIVNIPSPKLTFLHNNSSEIKYASAVVNLLADVIAKNEEIVFQMNYIDDLQIIRKLKEKYQHPVISVVHFSQWQQLFNGNKQKLNGLNIDFPTNNIEFTILKEKEMYQFSDHIISINRFMKDFLVERYSILPDKIDLVNNGINYGRYQIISREEKFKLKHNLGFRSDEKIILFSGRIDADKGIFFLLDAFTDACKFRDDLRLVLIGQGNFQECLQKYQLVYGKITFTGFLSPDKIMAFYQIADIGVVPSLYEQCSYSRLEMMALNIPLILSRIDGFRDMFENEQCMFIDPIISADGEISFNYKEFSNAILSLAGDDQKAVNLARNAYKNLVNNFSASRMAEEMNNLFNTITNNKKAAFEYEKSGRR
jgi:glycosyltransferase involved in cell wall biosynthesis